jgi:hypothetical protein
MKKLLRRLVAVGSALLVPTLAFAYLSYPTTDGSVGGAAINAAGGTVLMWLNGSGQAVPLSAANPLPTNTGTFGNSPANPFYSSIVQNGAGTNVLNVSSVPLTGTWSYSGSGSAVLIGPIDMVAGNYNSVAFSIQNIGGGAVMNMQAANDPTSDTWVAAPCARAGDYLPASAVAFASSFSCGTMGLRYFRAFISGWTTGTVNGYYSASQAQPVNTVIQQSFNALSVTPKAGTYTVAGATVGTSSAQVLAAGTYNHVLLQNNHATAKIACRWGGTAALNDANSFTLYPLVPPTTFGPNTSGVSAAALNCISDNASTPLYIERN